MKRTIVGIALAAVALYAWGFVFWGLGPYRTMVWNQTKDDRAAGQALLEYFAENGTYYVPGFDHDQATIEEFFKRGPVAFVHMISTTGRSIADPSIMIQGFVLNLVVIILVSVLLYQVRAAFQTYLARLKFVALVGIVATVFIDFGAAVWWQIDWSWKLYQAFYSFSAFLIIGSILAKFAVPKCQQGASQ